MRIEEVAMKIVALIVILWTGLWLLKISVAAFDTILRIAKRARLNAEWKRRGVIIGDVVLFHSLIGPVKNVVTNGPKDGKVGISNRHFSPSSYGSHWEEISILDWTGENIGDGK